MNTNQNLFEVERKFK